MNKLVFSLMCVMLITGYAQAQEQNNVVQAAGSLAGADTKNCSFETLEGAQMKLSDFQGKPVVLFFWTTWCPYCRESMRKLNERYDDISSSGVELLAVNVDEPKETVVRFLAGRPTKVRVVRDIQSACAHIFGVMGVPTYIFIDKTGAIIDTKNELPQNYREIFSIEKKE